VAAKVLKRSDEIALGDFRTEIAILRKISHPNCVQVWGASGASGASGGLRFGVWCAAGCGLAVVGLGMECAFVFLQMQLFCCTQPSKPKPTRTTTTITTTTTKPKLHNHHPYQQFLGACTKQKPYIVLTELMACSLADAFNKTFYAPTQRRQVEIALDFARGMAYLHSRRQPIVHRVSWVARLQRGLLPEGCACFEESLSS